MDAVVSNGSQHHVHALVVLQDKKQTRYWVHLGRRLAGWRMVRACVLYVCMVRVMGDASVKFIQDEAGTRMNGAIHSLTVISKHAVRRLAIDNRLGCAS